MRASLWGKEILLRRTGGPASLRESCAKQSAEAKFGSGSHCHAMTVIPADATFWHLLTISRWARELISPAEVYVYLQWRVPSWHDNHGMSQARLEIVVRAVCDSRAALPDFTGYIRLPRHGQAKTCESTSGLNMERQLPSLIWKKLGGCWASRVPLVLKLREGVDETTCIDGNFHWQLGFWRALLQPQVQPNEPNRRTVRKRRKAMRIMSLLHQPRILAIPCPLRFLNGWWFVQHVIARQRCNTLVEVDRQILSALWGQIGLCH